MLSVERFMEPQKDAYAIALEEIRRGRKVTHWMWFIFPQLRGLGQSNDAWYYGIENLTEAKAYLEHPILGRWLREITQAALDLPESDPMKIFGWPDHMKFRSCMTLFNLVSQEELFAKALDQFFDGQEDFLTLELLRQKGDTLSRILSFVWDTSSLPSGCRRCLPHGWSGDRCRVDADFGSCLHLELVHCLPSLGDVQRIVIVAHIRSLIFEFPGKQGRFPVGERLFFP